jgi:hypothetical protein
MRNESSTASTRRTKAVESFRTAAECIGPIQPGMSLFAITRGQFSMVDALIHVMDRVGPSRVSVWTWTVSRADVETLMYQLETRKVTAGLLVIDPAVLRSKKERGGMETIERWSARFGPSSVRWLENHAKIATVEGAGLRVLLRGSMNLTRNPRYEQFDITEGGPDFELVRRIEEGLPVLGGHAKAQDYVRAIGTVGVPHDLPMLAAVKTWKP